MCKNRKFMMGHKRKKLFCIRKNLYINKYNKPTNNIFLTKIITQTHLIQIISFAH